MEIRTQEWPDQPGSGMYRIWCEACRHYHTIFTIASEHNKVIWGFNGNLEKPTFTPSVKVTWPDNEKEHCCHFHVIDGTIQYCGDCTHDKSGQTLQLRPEKIL